MMQTTWWAAPATTTLPHLPFCKNMGRIAPSLKRKKRTSRSRTARNAKVYMRMPVGRTKRMTRAARARARSYMAKEKEKFKKSRTCNRKSARKSGAHQQLFNCHIPFWAKLILSFDCWGSQLGVDVKAPLWEPPAGIIRCSTEAL